MHQNGFRIGSKWIGKRHPCFVIAEAGSNHNGDLTTAKKLIATAARIGADAIKFQLFKGEELSAESKIQEILRKYEFKRKWLDILNDYAKEKDIIFFATPFDEKAVDELDLIDVPVFKIASGDLTNFPLIEYIADKKKPIILSVGVGTLKEIEESLKIIYQRGNHGLSLLHCVADYPTRIEDVNLRVIETLRYKFKIPIGFSDHTMDSIIPALAVSQGACIIEKHFTFSRKMKGPDHSFALEPAEFQLMVENIRKAEKALGTAKKGITPTERGVLKTGRRSLYARRFIPRGMMIQKEDIAILRPNQGIPPSDLNKVIGKMAKRNISLFEAIHWKDLDGK